MPVPCPHCGKPTIAVGRRLYAIDACPARCPMCGGLSYVGTSLRYNLLIFIPAVFAAVLFESRRANPVLGVVGLAMLLAAVLFYMRFAPLVPITPRGVRFARRWYVISWSVLAVLVTFGVMYLRKHAP